MSDDGGRAAAEEPATQILADVIVVEHVQPLRGRRLAVGGRCRNDAVLQTVQDVGRRRNVAGRKRLPNVELGVGRARVDGEEAEASPAHPFAVGEGQADVTGSDAAATVLEGHQVGASFDADEGARDGRAGSFAVSSGATGSATATITTGSAASAAASAAGFVGDAVTIVVDAVAAGVGRGGGAGDGRAIVAVFGGVASEHAAHLAGAHTVAAGLTDEGVRGAGVAGVATAARVEQADDVVVGTAAAADKVAGLPALCADFTVEGVVHAGGARVGRVGGADRRGGSARAEEVTGLAAGRADLIVIRVLLAGGTRIASVAEAGDVIVLARAGAVELARVAVDVDAVLAEQGVVEAGAAPRVVRDANDLETVGVARAHVVPGLARRGVDAVLPIVRVVLARLAAGVGSTVAAAAFATYAGILAVLLRVAVAEIGGGRRLIAAARRPEDRGEAEERHEGAQDDDELVAEPRGCRGTLFLFHGVSCRCGPLGA